MIINRLFLRNIASDTIDSFSRSCSFSIQHKRGTYLVCRYHIPKFSVGWTTFSKHLPSLLSRPLSIGDHQIPSGEFSSPFLTWQPHLIDHCDPQLGSSFKLWTRLAFGVYFEKYDEIAIMFHEDNVPVHGDYLNKFFFHRIWS